MTRLPIASAVLAALLALTACSSSGSGSGHSSSHSPAAGAPASSGTSSSSAVAASGPRITIKNFGFSGTLTVRAGQRVTVVNEDSVAHTLTDKKTHRFDTGNINGNGGTGSFVAPKTPGKYPFGCDYHPEMAGTLTVTG